MLCPVAKRIPERNINKSFQLPALCEKKLIMRKCSRNSSDGNVETTIKVEKRHGNRQDYYPVSDEKPSYLAWEKKEINWLIQKV